VQVSLLVLATVGVFLQPRCGAVVGGVVEQV
jgi:hypothetical protein